MRLESVLGPVDALVSVPGSKSITNRVLICAALGNGLSILENVATGDDTARLIRCLREIGVSVRLREDSAEIDGLAGRVLGGADLNTGLAGTTSRFLTALACLGESPTRIDGDAPLRRRPMGDLHSALRSLGAEISPQEKEGHLPVLVRRGELHGGSVRIRGDVSSQFITALMLIAPYLEEGLTIELTSSLVSRPYVEMTAEVMATFGVLGVSVQNSRIHVPAGEYAGITFTVEPDASSASYPFAAAAILGGRVSIKDFSRSSMQGDKQILDILERMGCAVEEGLSGCSVSRHGNLNGIDIDMSDVSDLVPTIAAVALFASSPTRIRNIGFIRSKESDRIGDLRVGIELIGGRAEEFPDGLQIFPMKTVPTEEVVPPTKHDHRLAMAWSLIALRRPGIAIDDPNVVDKSWPDWWRVREALCRSSAH